ncbi:hypothetical protein BDV34DRAFT_227326 [Aspergillus parasiticus]|uniref:Uncharacterized protein n=1 Tax=Aspergillus parasiticus TaxID=5067 RepID=A0A5N6DEC5_ASPPA|nr:hypothetical protein BDV34DRAFT_227326 [Aspergillus parasiticus]
MKFLQNCSVLAVLVAFSNAASISTSPRQISTTEDIPELPEGFTWRIVERPVGNDTNFSRAAETAELKQLQKRILAVGCVGASANTTNFSVKQLITVELALTHAKLAGSPPLIDDCNTLNTQIQNYQQTLLVQPGYCHEATYGTCLTYVCAKCRQVAIDTNKWYDVNQAIINHYVDNGEAGYGYDNEDNEYEIGIEHSGDQLPSYIC